MCKKTTFLYAQVGWCIARKGFEFFNEMRVVVVSTFYGNSQEVFIGRGFQASQGMFESGYFGKHFWADANCRFESAFKMPLAQAYIGGNFGKRDLSFCTTD